MKKYNLNPNCCTHYQNFEYKLGHIMLPCFKVVVCQNCNETQLICNKYLQKIFGLFFAPFWNGKIWIDENCKPLNLTNKVILINGSGSWGKDTFVECCKEIETTNIFNLSTVDFVKKIATLCGWDGTKSEKNRKFLSDLKDLLEEWNDVPNTIINNNISYIFGSIIFIHVREPKNLTQLKAKYNATTVLINNPNIEQITSNHADAEVMNYNYDYIIDNDGTIENLKEKAKWFINEIKK